MKKLFFILLLVLGFLGMSVQAQISRIRKGSSALNHRERESVNTVINDMNAIMYPTDQVYTEPQIYYMNRDIGDDATGDGTEDNPYATFNRMVKEVRTTSGGVVLHLGPGKFTLSAIHGKLRNIQAQTLSLFGSYDSIGTISNLVQDTAHTFKYTCDETFADDALEDVRYLVGGLSFPIYGNTDDTLIITSTSFDGSSGTLVSLTTELDFDVPLDIEIPIIAFRNLTLTPNKLITLRGNEVNLIGCDLFETVEGNNGITTQCLRATFMGCNIQNYSDYSAWQSLRIGHYGFVSHCIFKPVVPTQAIDVNYDGWYAVTNVIFDNTAGALYTQNSTCDLVGDIYVKSNVSRAIFNFDEETGSYTSKGGLNADTVHMYVDTTSLVFYGTPPGTSNHFHVDLRSVQWHLRDGFTLPSNSYYAVNDLDERIFTFWRDTTSITRVDSLHVTGFIQPHLTGSLTDGTPTDAEIDAVTGLTPSAVGAGWQITILDSDGSGLLYRIVSDGTNWSYWTGVRAL